MDVTTVGPYEILEELGHGGMGIVYRAHQASLHRVIALKVLPRELEHDREAVRRFQEEGVTAARLRHEHVVAVYDAHVDEPPYYIAMEFLEGESLSELVRSRGRLGPDTAADIAVQLCRALDHAHSRGIIHRDVKPANVIVSPGGKVTLTDFGIARMQDRTQVTSAGAVLGSPHYMAPEQAQGKPADSRSDVYGCGAVLYAMLTGTAPFQGDDTLAVMYQIVHHDAPAVRESVPEVPAELEAMVAKALSRDPEARYQSTAEFMADLESLPRGQGDRPARVLDEPATLVGTVPPTSEAVFPMQGRKRPWARLGAAAVVIFAAVAFALYVAFPRAVPRQPVRTRSGPAVSPRVEGTRLPDKTPATATTAQVPAVPAASPTQSPPGIGAAQVPDLSNRTEQEAGDAVKALGLTLAVAGTSPHDVIAEGRVISQDPKPGETRSLGEKVTVKFSSGPPKPAPRPAGTAGSHRPRRTTHSKARPKPPPRPASPPKSTKPSGGTLLPP